MVLFIQSLLLELSILCLTVTLPLASSAPSKPNPIVVSPSQYWEGNDGPWSTFPLRVGTPAQNVRVLISTSNQETWVVVPEGCTQVDPSNCGTLRGGEFLLNQSSTWANNSLWELGAELNLGYSGNGEYGFDSVGLGWQGSGGPTLEHQVVAGIAAKDFLFGIFGLTPRPVNFTNFNEPQPSFLHSLKNQSLIPSQAWGYTAGAKYRLDGETYGSLTLGGFDASRFDGNNMTFAFGSDISRDLIVSLASITTSSDGNAASSDILLHSTITTFIDSAVPQIWLPISACQSFETAFGLQYNDTVDLYLVNDTLHSDLLARNASFTFSLAAAGSATPTLEIILPYASFDLLVDWPIVGAPTRYFPLRRAANESQYTLGRAFLQEAYLIVDYERSNFSVSQARFSPNMTQDIVTIQPLDSGTKSRSGLSGGAIGGIVAACVVVLVTAGLLYIRFRRKRHRGSPETETSAHVSDPDMAEIRSRRRQEATELEGAAGGYELEAKDTQFGTYEADGEPRKLFELPAVEDPAAEIESPQSPTMPSPR